MTKGGIGNQRECIINAVLLARQLGLGVVLPAVHVIAHAHQDYLESRGSSASYLPPFDDREEWGRFDLVFDEHRFVHAVRGLGVPVLAELPQGR